MGKLDEEDNLSLFDVPRAWEKEWQGMPEFTQKNNEAKQKITISFASYADVEKFAKLIGQNVTPKTNSVWFPKLEIKPPKCFVYTDES